jgi:hypothetical protein
VCAKITAAVPVRRCHYGCLVSRLGWLVLGVAILLATGCSRRFAAVEGTVLVDGKPAMEGVQVFFSPLGDTRPAEGAVVGADGGFTMRTMNEVGVMPGEYSVCLINSTNSIPKPTSDPNFVPVNGDPPADWFAHLAAVNKFLENPPVGPGWIPKAYANHAETPLTVTVQAGRNQPVLEVQSTPPPAVKKSR